jgi:hypothetical protein
MIIYREKDHFENEIYDEVHVYLNVSVALMLNWIFCELDGTMIFTLVCGQMRLLESKL